MSAQKIYVLCRSQSAYHHRIDQHIHRHALRSVCRERTTLRKPQPLRCGSASKWRNESTRSRPEILRYFCLKNCLLKARTIQSKSNCLVYCQRGKESTGTTGQHSWEYVMTGGLTGTCQTWYSILMLPWEQADICRFSNRMPVARLVRRKPG